MNLLGLGVWDAALVLAVSAQATALAYLYNPRWKALVWMLPIPFTVASLAVGRPVDATNLLGLHLLLLYTHSVRWLYQEHGVPIVAAIAAGAALYIAGGWGLAAIVPASDTAFWIVGVVTLGVGGVLLWNTRAREEAGHRSPLPLWIKLPAIVTVVTVLLLLKRGLAGFTTVFPMVGVIAAYEARHSLHTLARAVPGILLTLTPMMMTCRLLQARVGLGAALVAGWAVYLAFLAALAPWVWRGGQAAESSDSRVA